MVDIGGGTTDISIFHDNIIRHTAVIPLGGDIVTQDIKEGLGLPRHHAEALKIKFGKALYVKRPIKEYVKIKGEGQREDKKILLDNLYKIIEARMEEIFEKVHQEILNMSFTRSSLPKVNNFGKLVTERIKGFLKDDDLTEFKDEN